MRFTFQCKVLPLWFTVITVVAFFTACQNPQADYMFLQGNTQGTTYSVKYKSVDRTDFSVQLDSIFTQIDMSMSTYKPNSIISRINTGEDSVRVDKHFSKVFYQSLSVYEASGGAFDPTVGPLVNAYGFGKESENIHIDSHVLDSLRQYVGFRKVTLQESYLQKEYPQIKIDFNAIAQGYTVDVVVDFLKDHGITDYMVEIGGEVRAGGVNPEGKPWSIGIQNPENNEIGALETIISLNDQSVATSGNYRKFKVDEKGHKYVHTINPQTGEAEPSNLLSATVVTKLECAFADAYATTLMVLGYEKSLDFLKNHPELEVFLIYVDADGKTQTYTTVKKN